MFLAGSTNKEGKENEHLLNIRGGGHDATAFFVSCFNPKTASVLARSLIEEAKGVIKILVSLLALLFFCYKIILRSQRTFYRGKEKEISSQYHVLRGILYKISLLQIAIKLHGFHLTINVSRVKISFCCS